MRLAYLPKPSTRISCPKANAMTEHSLLDHLLQKLLATDDPTEKAAIVAESAFEQLPVPVALVAQRCTVLRWFDETLVTALLDAPPSLEHLPIVQTIMNT